MLSGVKRKYVYNYKQKEMFDKSVNQRCLFISDTHLQLLSIQIVIKI
jgi:hypothetical protein